MTEGPGDYLGTDGHAFAMWAGGLLVPLTTWGLIQHLEKIRVPAQGRGIRENVTQRGEKNRGSDSPNPRKRMF